MRPAAHRVYTRGVWPFPDPRRSALACNGDRRDTDRARREERFRAGRERCAGRDDIVDEVVDKLERRAVDHREKPRVRARPEQEKQILRRIADGTSNTDREPEIVKTKRFAIEPMFEEDAATQMEELGHQFFVFVNAETERVCILYRRNDGDLGLIEPVIGGEYTKGRSKARSNGSH